MKICFSKERLFIVMRLVKVNALVANRALRKYQKLVLNEIRRLEKTKTVQELIKMYGEDDVFSAYTCIYLGGNYICFDDSSKSGIILRYLQYGGPRMPALNVLSTTAGALGGSLI